MDFKAFRILKGWNLERAATEMRDSGHPDLARINGSLIHKHETGARFPRPGIIAGYAAISDGAVTAEDWVRAFDERRRVEGAAPERRMA